QRVLDVLHAHPAHAARDQRHVGVELRRTEEVLKRRALLEVVVQGRAVKAGQPLDDLVELLLRASLSLDLRHVVRIYRREAVGEDPAHTREGSAPMSTARTSHVPGTPASVCSPWGRNVWPDPRTRSRTVPLTSTSPAVPRSATRAATWTATPR